MRLRFLGTGSAVGVPAFFCGCRACEEAIADGKARRTRSSVVLEGEAFYLLDASPDLRTQFLREHVSRLDGLFLTHQHFLSSRTLTCIPDEREPQVARVSVWVHE